MPFAQAATQKAMSAAAGRSWYLLEVRKRSREGDNPRSPSGRKRSLLTSCLTLLLPCLVELRDLLHKALGHRVLLAGVALEPNEGEEPVRLLVLGLAVGEAWEPAEPPPVRRARVGVVASRQRLCREGTEELWEDDRMFEPRLEVAGTCLDHGARSEAVCCELRERDLGEIVEDGVAMLTGWPDVDVRAACIAVLE